MSKPSFSKVYFGGEFKTLIAMYSFDRHVPEFRDREWEQTEQVGDRTFDTGYSTPLPRKKD